MKKRTLCLLLILTSLLAACGSSDTPPDETTAADTTTAASEEGYSYGSHDLGGKTFVFLNCPKDQWSMHNTIQPDELNGESVNDAMFNRNEYVKSRLNCKIVEQNTDDIYKINQVLQTSVMAGDDEYQVAYLPMHYSMSAIGSGQLTCLDDYDGLSLDQPWWNQALLDATSIGGKHYFAASSLHLMSIDGIWCMFFNQDMMDELKLEYPYQLVRDGVWTLDKLNEYSSAAANLNGDDSFALNSDGKSVYGTVSIANGIPKFLYGAGVDYVVKDSDDLPVLNLNDAGLTDALQSYARFFGAEGIFMNAAATQSFEAYAGGVTPYIGLFMSNRALFIGTEVKVAGTLRPMEQTFGVVPFPKLDESQPAYRATAVHQLCVATIPVTNGSAEDTALLLDALSFESDRMVLDTYLTQTVEQKGLRNEESIEMLKLIRESLSFDPGIAYQLVTPLENQLKNLLLAGDENVSSAIAGQQSAVQANLDTLLKEIGK
ncbi:MAG: hypothetical protein IJ493_07985 [Clostridia bacterium]|nr:hypothetical protein [Clostridia bacterium]